ncbi:MAG: CapA family protein [Blautia sp.]|uniref:CapA family protein n=2 Tax=Blautia sp. TaxID=1955243 RepID=UPI0025BEC19C|nr:CapA family protein [Blautia sp.]MCI6303315.1 CapA family protein [Blautia sp.]MCI7448329.1 CapA family protein [Blautia sp.]MDD6414174.1 CapA family protein [Blautia sp.]
MKKNNIPLNFREKINSRISLLCSVVALIILMVVIHQIDYTLISKPQKEAVEAAALEEQKAKEAAETPEISTASVIAVGDNLYHSKLYESGEYDSGVWNYDHIYTHVLDQIQAADVAMIDQETVFAPSHDAVSSYPSFATPQEVGDAIIKAGFNVVESATNHADDYGYDYLKNTLDFWSTNYPDIPVLGIHATQEDADTVKTKEVNGIKIAFLDYTYGTNNSGLGDGYDYMLDIFDKDKITSMIQKAKQVSDCIIFVAHWGTEDETMPNEFEKQWAAFLMQQGVDVIIGGHPHVLQPYGQLSDDQGHSTTVFYSLGNFVSTQQELPELLEGMASFTIQKSTLNGKSTIQILSPEVKPMVMHYNHDSGEYGPYMLDDYTEELAASHSVRNLIGDEFTLENLKAKFKEIMSMNVKPSTNTNLLNVKFDWEGNMIDKTTGNVVEDTESIHSWEYLASVSDGSSDSTGSSDGNSSNDSSDSGDSNYDSTSYDNGDNSDSSYDNSSYDSSYDSGYDNYDSSYDSGYDNYDSSYDSSYDNYDSSYDESYDNYDDSYDSGY